MKRLLTILWVALAASGLMAQTLNDTVSIGAGYGLQNWYSLSSGQSTTASKTEWDLGFDLSPQGASILFNTVSGAGLWAYPQSDTTGWATLDTAGISTWEMRWNSDTSWAMGALSRYVNPLDPFDLGWGIYSTFTHNVTGDSLFVVKLANGAYKKLWIRRLGSGTYTLTHADLNGANTVDRSIAKAAYSGKSFIYYALQNDAVLDREPLAADWDLVFTQYTAFIPSAYSVTGVLAREGIQVAKVDGVADVNNYTDWSSANFGTSMNGIGYDWKAFAGSWVIADSLLYFVKKANGEVWKLVFTGFGGSANGEMHFSKELLATTSTTPSQSDIATGISLYPNPSDGSSASLRYALDAPCRDAHIAVTNLAGQVVFETAAPATKGMHQLDMELNLVPGFYFLDLVTDGLHHPSRMVVR